ncbi:YbhB/YbcL family Raf kinase inhibitor-like protein [Candidatus Soleaferrea massiliensis]|uniref:YbhB/YbcL family Raf kinase inhibitor-like protein n=1 Tax=Candidatus Soleaferrea massiliensis TaxID=1470354 RepID=UPI00058D8006|nr:YbhB/YbcL family Raf kinase inhibitor-like protein [Candidatus Soleaferrea massiliensis]
MSDFKVSSPDFCEGGWMPKRNTARGEDLSPCLRLEGISGKASSIAVTMDDASHPIFPNYNHWVIWNIPVQPEIPPAVAHEKIVEDLGNAVQGMAYGRHRYKGPKPPLKALHTYVFTVYVLDCLLQLPPDSKKAQLLAHMQGHILQQAALSGKYQNGHS